MQKVREQNYIESSMRYVKILTISEWADNKITFSKNITQFSEYSIIKIASNNYSFHVSI